MAVSYTHLDVYKRQHLDIAGTAWDKKGRTLSQPGATAFGVRLLDKLITDKFEK